METNTLLSSKYLYHYTDNKGKFISILKNGFYPAWSLEDTDKVFQPSDNSVFIQNTEGGEKKEYPKYAFPMVCFCDIPLELTENHRKVYGEYAIGLNKSWGEKHGISPVMYLTHRAFSQSSINKIYEFEYNFYKDIIKRCRGNYRNNDYTFTPLQLNSLIENFIELSMFFKPYKGYFKKGEYECQNHKFYDEREWRYKPDNTQIPNSFKLEEEFEVLDSDDIVLKNSGSRLRFEINDIAEIIIPKNEKEEIIEVIKNMPEFKGFDFSKIKTWESIIETS